MAISVSHPKVSTIPDDPASVAAGEVVPSDWNAVHSISGTLDVANGGTGTTTSTGIGSVVLSTGPQLTGSVEIAGSIVFSGATSGEVTIAPANVAGTWTLTLPTSAGNNGYVLSTDGTGVTSWVAQTGGGGGGSSVGSDIFLANGFGGF